MLKKITILTTNYLPPSFKYDEKEIPRNQNRKVKIIGDKKTLILKI